MEDIVDLAKKVVVSDRMYIPPSLFQEYKYLWYQAHATNL